MTPTEVDDDQESDNRQPEDGSGEEEDGDNEESELDDEEREYWEVKKANAKAEGKKWVKVGDTIFI